MQYWQWTSSYSLWKSEIINKLATDIYIDVITLQEAYVFINHSTCSLLIRQSNNLLYLVPEYQQPGLHLFLLN